MHRFHLPPYGFLFESLSIEFIWWVMEGKGRVRKRGRVGREETATTFFKEGWGPLPPSLGIQILSLFMPPTSEEVASLKET